MNLVKLRDVTVTIDNQKVFNKFNLTIESKQQLGLKLTSQEGRLLIDLLSKKIAPASGKVITNSQRMVFKTADDGLYEKMTVKNYLKLFKNISGKKLDLIATLEEFFLAEVMNSKIETVTIDQRELLHLLRSYLVSPDIIFIESPLHNLSVVGTANYLKAIQFMRQQGLTMIFISSSIEELRLVSNEIYQSIDGLLEPITLDKVDLKLISRHNGQMNIFEPSEIDFIESINSISNLYVKGEYYSVTLTMDELTAKLADSNFFRCHRSYLVNLTQIEQVVSYAKNSYTLVLKNAEQSKIPLSRTKLDKFKELIGTTQA